MDGGGGGGSSDDGGGEGSGRSGEGGHLLLLLVLLGVRELYHQRLAASLCRREKGISREDRLKLGVIKTSGT